MSRGWSLLRDRGILIEIGWFDDCLARPFRRTFFEKRGDAFLRFVRFPRLHVMAESERDVVRDR